MDGSYLSQRVVTFYKKSTTIYIGKYYLTTAHRQTNRRTGRTDESTSDSDSGRLVSNSTEHKTVIVPVRVPFGCGTLKIIQIIITVSKDSFTIKRAQRSVERVVLTSTMACHDMSPHFIRVTYLNDK